MMSAHVVVLAVLVACYVTGHVSGQGCEGSGEPMIDWRSNITCPDRAVCADVFNNWQGSTCNLIVSRCLCRGGTVCPWGSSNHRMYITETREQYTCRPVCTLPYCPYIQSPWLRDRNGYLTAMTRVHRSRDFSGRTYNKVTCRCQGNHVRPAGDDHAYTLHRMKMMGKTKYRCDHTEAEGEMPDPCDE